MIKFEMEFLEMFLGVVRKYMQLRGGLSQKDLAIKVNVGISTMSRFLNQKTKEIDPQMIASIVANLAVPLHEIIDFIAEDSTSTFKKLVEFYKEGDSADMNKEALGARQESVETTPKQTVANIRGVNVPFGGEERRDQNLTMKEKLNLLTPRHKGFLNDFLDMDLERKDLIVDIGNNVVKYFKQSDMKFE